MLMANADFKDTDQLSEMFHTPETRRHVAAKIDCSFSTEVFDEVCGYLPSRPKLIPVVTTNATINAGTAVRSGQAARAMSIRGR